MLDIKRVIAARPKVPDGAELTPLLTPWGERIVAGEKLVEPHPRPQFERAAWTSLDGDDWEYAVTPTSAEPEAWEGRIRVPFSIETELSGVGRALEPTEFLWYRRSFAAPELPQGGRCLLHFEAVDYACSVWLNGVHLGDHTGGYLPFVYDVTDAIAGPGEKSELRVRVWDPSNKGTQPRGKQRLDRGGIWYTPTSGIWQPVWLEVVPAAHLTSLAFEPDVDREELRLTLGVEGGPADLMVWAEGDGNGEGPEGAFLAANDFAGGELTLDFPDPHLWSPSDPYLYQLRITFGDDEVQSYCAFRTVSMERDAAGALRLCVNHEPVYLRGLLDQGYWSDGGLTAPADDALAFDVQTARDLGFNLLRKHIKVEPDRWYWHCDRLGMLVMQDMPSGGTSPYSEWQASYKPTFFPALWSRFDDTTARGHAALGAADPAFRDEWMATCEGAIDHLRNHPSIVAWCVFNEGWGQFDAAAVTARVRELDPTRAIDATSGWYDRGVGDFLSVHNYFRPLEVYRDHVKPARAFLLSEFGGLSCRVGEHSALQTSYGYDTVDDPEAFRAELAELLAKADALEEAGCAGFVYTQLTDVEEETNGLLTYDRRVCKLPRV